MPVCVVNSVWRGEMQLMVSLQELLVLCLTQEHVREARLQSKQPQQLIIRFNDGSTMLVFKSGKFHVMGGKIDDLDAHFNICRITALLDQYPVIMIQTMTAIFTYPHQINLVLLALNLESYYDPESFPAVNVHIYKPIVANVFASGKVIITGLKDEVTGNDIEIALTSVFDTLQTRT